ncbi:hypothetical protein ACJMK2_004811 [Sinanodonta woodiana]|uniref:Uncharacterized protein n=1 Tax=Sinanodonta woodiana TaxID=1069815 RepID=A0ABD3VN44_SINWO
MADVNSEKVTVDYINRYTVERLKRFLKEHRQYVSGQALEFRERALGVLCLQTPSEININNANQCNQETLEIGKYTTLGETLPKPDTLDGWRDDVSTISDFSERELYNGLVLKTSRTFTRAPCDIVKQLKAKQFYEDNHIHSVHYQNVNSRYSHAYVRCSVIPSLPTVDTY